MSLFPYSHHQAVAPWASPYSFFAPELQHLQRELGVVDTKDGNFHYRCQLGGFRPDEVEVHQEGDTLVISASQKHEGHGEHFQRTLKRVVAIPKDVHHESIRTEINERGELVIHGEKKAVEGSQRKKIPIEFKHSDKQKK
ncbi:SHSP domain-containing protein [Aphelenchoides fujianensis]|nr:SHSP domain-containing protein [Aphelenchoides fujianensis]